MSKLILSIVLYWARCCKLILRFRRRKNRTIPSITLIQIKHSCRAVRAFVPGRRIPMTEDELFNHWLLTHQYKVRRTWVSLESSQPTQDELIDLGLTMYANYPEVIEHGEN